MKAKFDSTKTIGNIIIALSLITIAAIFIVGFSQENELLMFIPTAVFVVIINFILSAFHGEIIAGEKGVVIIYTFCGKKVGKKSVAYRNIDRTECGVETVGGRMGRVSHIMKFTIKIKGGLRITVSKQLDIGASFPAEQPYIIFRRK